MKMKLRGLLFLFFLPAISYGFDVGIGVQAHSGTFDAAGQAFTKELGAKFIRVGYNHGDHNANINWAAQNGVGVSFFLGYSAGCNAVTPTGRQCYADRAAALAKLHGTKVKYWEVWNEWNGGIGLGCSWGQANTPCTDFAMYKDLLCRTYAAVKAAHPGALIVGGATAGTDINFIGKVIDLGGASCMDMISVHPYIYGLRRVAYTAPPATAVDAFMREINNLNNMVRQKTGRTIPIMVTEEGRSDGMSASQEKLTADYITELYRRAPSMPFLTGIWWFSLEDPTNDSSAVGYGLLRSNNAKKLGFAAFKAVATATPSPTPTENKNLKGLFRQKGRYD